MANADGGLILLGVEVEEERDEEGRTVGLRPLALHGLRTGEGGWGQFQKAILSGVSPPVEGLEFYPMTLRRGGTVGFVEVPQSSVGVHRAPDGRYYIRRGFAVLRLGEAEIATIQARRSRPKLLPRLEIARIDAGSRRLGMRIHVENRGRVTAPVVDVSLRFSGATTVGPGTPQGGPGRLHWRAPGPLGREETLGVGEVSLTYQGDFGVEVAVSSPGHPAELYYFLIPGDLPAEVQDLVPDDEGWQVPPAEPREIPQGWFADA
jgi:hypothetical protein